jgi:hypothetical protein
MRAIRTNDERVTMRPSSLRALAYTTTILPAGALLAACFGGSSNSTSTVDAAFPDSGGPPPAFDAGHPVDSGHPGDSTTGDGANDAPAPADAFEAATSDAPADVPIVPNDGGDGASPSPLATFSTAPVDFGLVDCGTAPASTKTYTFQNVGAAPLTYSASLGAASVFTIQGSASGTLQTGDTATITIAAAMVPASSTAGTALTDVLTITTNVPGFASVTVPVQVTPHGGSLTVSPSVVGFGQVQLSTMATPMPVTITNVGNAPVGLTLGAPSNPDFSVTYTGGPAAVTLPAAGTVPGAQAQFAPTSAAMESATVALKTTGVMCASAVTSISLTGEGTTEPVTVAPSPIDFGNVSCGAAAMPRTVTITNGYSFAISYTAALASGAGFTIDVPSGFIPAQGKTAITITPKAIAVPGTVARNAYGDTLTVTTTAPSAAPVNVPLLESATGAVLAISMAKTAFGPVNANSSASLPFSVVNTGNENAALTLSVGGAGFTAAFTGSATAAAAGGSAPGNVTFSPPSASTTLASGTISVKSSGDVCVPAAPVTVTAQPEVAVAVFSTATVQLASTCPNGGTGANTTGNASLSITNNGDAPLAITGVTSSTPYVTAQGPSAGIAAGTSGSISMQTNVPANTPSGTYTGTLSFTTNELGSPPHTVPLSVAVHGANLVFVDVNGNALPNATINFSSGGCGSGAIFQYGVSNTGDTAVTVSGPTNAVQTAPPSQEDQNWGTARFCGVDVSRCGIGTGNENGIFEQTTPVTVASKQTVFDAIGQYDEYSYSVPIIVDNPCTNTAGSPIGPDLFAYSESGPVCVPLPQLTYFFNYGPFTNCECS